MLLLLLTICPEDKFWKFWNFLLTARAGQSRHHSRHLVKNITHDVRNFFTWLVGSCDKNMLGIINCGHLIVGAPSPSLLTLDSDSPRLPYNSPLSSPVSPWHTTSGRGGGGGRVVRQEGQRLVAWKGWYQVDRYSPGRFTARKMGGGKGLIALIWTFFTTFEKLWCLWKYLLSFNNLWCVTRNWDDE